MPAFYIGRQPIYDRQLKIVAYELLYRDGDNNRAQFVDGDAASSQVIVNACLGIGLERLIGEGRTAFINLTRAFLLQTYPMPLPKESVVLEVLEDIVLDEEMLIALRRLTQDGYSLALDDFVFTEQTRAAFEVVNIVKIDVLALGPDDTRKQVELLRQFNVKLLAEKVETHEILAQCQALGFDYFQGYFLSRPNLVQGRRPPAIRLAVLRTLALLQDPALDFKELEKAITQDVSLSYKLLRYINSAATGMPRKIDSIHQALVIAGTSCIRSWATLIALSSIDDKPHELMIIALIRAKMCELIAISTKEKAKENFFTVGLFSALDALMDQPLEEILGSMPLSDQANVALLRHEGAPGKALHATLIYEQGGDPDELRKTGLPLDTLSDAYLEALSWANQASKALF